MYQYETGIHKCNPELVRNPAIKTTTTTKSKLQKQKQKNKTKREETKRQRVFLFSSKVNVDQTSLCLTTVQTKVLSFFAVFSSSLSPPPPL